jgi:hypothetical protein
MSSKPLIFVLPLSETMTKLKESIEGIAEDEKIEIYEVDELTEVAQLVPTIGQSLTIYGNPKKCAMALKQLRKVNARLNSKVLLLNQKKIPRKTLDKFSKIGLTEFIQEPVAPKTLLYKVKLQLKSIVADSFDNDDEKEVKKESTEFPTGDEGEGFDTSKLKKESEVEEDDGYGYLRKKKKKSLYAEEDAEEKKKSNYEEDDIGTHWGGKLKKKDELEEGEEESAKKKRLEEEDLGGYYKGSTKKKVLEEDEEEENKKKVNLDEEDEDLYAESSNSKKLDLEEAEDRMKKQREEEEALEEDMRQEQLMDEMLGGHYKGKVKKQEEVEEEEEIRQKKVKLEEELDEPEIKEDSFEEEYDDEEKKKKTKLELEEEPDEITQEADEEEEDDGSKDAKLEIEESDFEPEDKTKKEELEELEDKDKRDKEKADEIDKYYRGDVNKDDEEEDEDDGSNDIELDKAMNLEGDGEDFEEKNQDHGDDEDLDFEREKDTKLDLEDENDSKDRDKDEDDEDGDGNMRGSVSKGLDLEDDKERKEDEEEDEEDFEARDKRKSNELLEEDEESNKKFDKEELEGGDFERRKAQKDLDLEEDKEKMSAKSKTDKIQGHYSNKKSVSHVDDDWDLGSKKKTQVQDEEDKVRNETEISFAGKKDLGEQTIDYSKLHEEFGGITIDREGDSKKRKGPKYHGGGKADPKKTPSYYRDDEQGDGEDFDSAEEEQKEKPRQIFEPNSVGLEVAVNVLSFYYKKETKPEEVYKYIGLNIENKFNGNTTLFFFDRVKGKFLEEFNSLSEKNQEEVEEHLQYWDKLKNENFTQWTQTMLPTWSDLTFQNKEIQFIYPFFEGATCMGFAITYFQNGFEEDLQKTLEVYLETQRGFYLNKFHEAGNKGQYKGTSGKEQKTGKIKGFFKKLFGKKAS